jgi:hypothetical protein
MRIQNLKAPQQPAAAAGPDSPPADTAAVRNDAPPAEPGDRQALEIAFLKARIQHLELVVETARSLMGSNHERLLRRLHEVPRELVDLGNRLRRYDLQATW